MGKKSFTSMRVKLLFWFVLISIAPLTIAGITLYLNSQNIIKKGIFNELSISGSGIEGKVSAFIEGKKNTTLNFCSDGIVKDGLTYYDPDDPQVDNLIKNTNFHLTKNKLSLDPYLEDILVLNLKGKVIFATNDKWQKKDKSKKDYFQAISKYLKDFKNKEWLERFKKDPRMIVYSSDFYVSDDLGVPVVAISNVITARSTGLPLGVLVNRYKGDMLNKLIASEGDTIGKSGKAYIVNKDGLLLSIPKYLDQSKKELLLKEQHQTKPIIQAQKEGKGLLGIYRDFRGQEVLGVSIVGKEKGWIIIAEKDIKEAFAPLYGLSFQILLIGVLSLVAVVLLSLFIASNMAKPILKLLGISEAIAKGDLTTEVDVKSNDEIGNLAVAFKSMVMAMHDMVAQVLNMADQVASSAQQLSSSTEEMNASTQEVSTAIQHVAKGASTQASQVSETSNAIERSSETLKLVVSNAEATSNAVNQTSDRAQKGRVAAQEAVEKITRLSDTVVSTAKVIQGLGEKSQAIGEITETITSIADQTNLLALNAAIEAARAGEAGRGFAVVAEEVRKLAEGSAEAVRKIDKLIKSIQSETQEAVTAIQASSQEVQEGRTEVSKIADILGDINTAVQEVNSLANQISDAMNKQVGENEQVVKSVNEVANIAKESAATAEQVSSSTEEQTASMQEMSASAQELARISMNLKELVSKFKVRKSASGKSEAAKPHLQHALHTLHTKR